MKFPNHVLPNYETGKIQIEYLRMLVVVHSTLAVCAEMDTEVLYILPADSHSNMESYDDSSRNHKETNNDLLNKYVSSDDFFF